MEVESKKKILIIDDEDTNIDVLRGALKNDYKILAAKDGEKAIDVIEKVLPDLILLDIIMPGMNGYEVIERLKSFEIIKDIPVIFLTALNEVTDKQKGFELGAVDYITKPFEIVEVQSRVKTHLELVESKKEVKNLLSKTLSGSIQMLLELLSVSNPVIFGLSNEIKRIVGEMAKKMNLHEIWKYELAGVLSHVGCFALTDQTFERIIKNQNITLEEQKLFASHPSIGAKIISKIPRFDSISKMVSNQSEPLGKLNDSSEEIIGAQLLSVASYYVFNHYRGNRDIEIINFMLSNPDRFNKIMLEVLSSITLSRSKLTFKELNIEELEVGMIIFDNIYSAGNKLLIRKGMQVNEIIIEHLMLLKNMGAVNSKVKILFKE